MRIPTKVKARFFYSGYSHLCVFRYLSFIVLKFLLSCFFAFYWVVGYDIIGLELKTVDLDI